jgi:hypothetical protein
MAKRGKNGKEDVRDKKNPEKKEPQKAFHHHKRK